MRGCAVDRAEHTLFRVDRAWKRRMKLQDVKRTFDDADRYLKRNSSILVRMRLINEMVKDLVFRRYIELGCGDGSIALSLLKEDKKLVLVDLSEVMIDKAREKTAPALVKNVTYTVGDIYSFQSEEQFDLVICVGVLAHVPSVEQLITKIGSLLKYDGYLVLQFTESNSLFGWFNYQFMKTSYGGYEVNKTSQNYLGPLLANQKLRVLEKRTYSDSSMGLGKLNTELAYGFKLMTSRLNLPTVFSEVIMLLKQTTQ
jgi:2-polyprenyl-3-methyl-5-hydroxy-6-metoxy-1,4-benzoquinol methylase